MMTDGEAALPSLRNAMATCDEDKQTTSTPRMAVIIQPLLVTLIRKP